MTAGFGPALAALDAACRATKARYAIIGGLGVSFWARPRATLDVDVLIAAPLDLVDVLCTQLEKQGARVEAVERQPALLMAGIRGAVGGTPMDVLVSANPMAADLVRHRRRRAIGGRRIWVLAAEELVVLKLQSGRPLDLEDVGSIVASRGSQLDLRRVDQLAKIFDVVGAWRRLRPR
jgi:hypothetical protein